MLGWRAFHCFLLHARLYDHVPTIVRVRPDCLCRMDDEFGRGSRIADPNDGCAPLATGWDCEESNQIWASCSDVTIKAA